MLRPVEKEVDILIIGGGLTGVSLMLALAPYHFKILLVDQHDVHQRSEPGFDTRALALSPTSVAILKQLQIWPCIKKEATPIHRIAVSQQGYFGATELLGQQPLGFVVEMHTLNHAFHQKLPPEMLYAPATLIQCSPVSGCVLIQHKDKQYNVRAQLIIAADGMNSKVRQFTSLSGHVNAYNQCAITANIGLARFHQGIAYERFTPQGPIALLPMQGNKASLVWALTPEEAARHMALSDKAFLESLQVQFGYKLGRFIKVGKRQMHPLKEMLMSKQIEWPIVFIGNAAHTLHPVAGQGFNLALRDAAILAQCIVKQGITPAMLKEYEDLRYYDQRSIYYFTRSLVQLFTAPLPGLGILRGLGLLTFDVFSGLKNTLARYAQGYGGIIPDLACGMDLKVSSDANKPYLNEAPYDESL